MAIFTLLHPAYSHAAEEWDEAVKRFLLPLTYPDFDPDDLGKETTDEDKALLEKFKPEIFISPKGIMPIDFYKDYLPHTVLIDKTGRIIKKKPSRKYLKQMERKQGYCLSFEGSLADLRNGRRVAYAQVIRENVLLRKNKSEAVEEPMTFLRYNFVFPISGLPAKLKWYKEIGARLLGDPELWHPLDIHGAIHIVLNRHGKPIVLILAQHNYHRTYLFKKDLPMPENNRVQISFAERSNEPYPAHAGNKPEYYRAADTPVQIEYILTGKNPSITTSEDRVYGTRGAQHIEYELEFLPEKDPLYTSWIPLGDRLKLFYFFDSWYRRGPPGMDLRTWPRLKKYGELMQFWYIQDNDPETASFMKKNITSFYNVNFDEILARNGSRLYDDLTRIINDTKPGGAN